MSQLKRSTDNAPAAAERPHFWTHILIPTARGFEGFVWRVAWFTLLIFVLFSFNPFR